MNYNVGLYSVCIGCCRWYRFVGDKTHAVSYWRCITPLKI